jgi:hypothetical protein
MGISPGTVVSAGVSNAFMVFGRNNFITDQ